MDDNGDKRKAIISKLQPHLEEEIAKFEHSEVLLIVLAMCFIEHLRCH